MLMEMEKSLKINLNNQLSKQYKLLKKKEEKFNKNEQTLDSYNHINKIQEYISIIVNIIQTMQANCLVFPSPKSYNLTDIQNKIILIPRSSDSNYHQVYHPLGCQSSSHINDQFSDYLDSLKKIQTPHSQTMKRSSSKTVAERSFDSRNSLEGNLNLKQKIDCKQAIPCLFLTGIKSQIIFFCHANGEDLCTSYQFLKMINFETKYAIIAMEYRGQTTPKNIQNDAARVMEFLLANKLASQQIILFGRSIGCAVALTVTQKYSVHSTILLSPFISLKKIATDLYGRCAGALLKEGFDNEQNCKQIKCPMLIIHGQKDTLVPCQHSFKLMSGCQSFCRLKIIQNMTHTKFNFRYDFIRHFTKFLADLE